MLERRACFGCRPGMEFIAGTCEAAVAAVLRRKKKLASLPPEFYRQRCGVISIGIHIIDEMG